MTNGIRVVRRFSHVALVALILACVSPARAYFFGAPEPAGPLVREAFESPYGRALVAELGKVLRADADPVCLQSKAIAAEQLPARGEQLIIAWGTRAVETMLSVLDVKAYEDAFAKSAGRNATVELKRLRETTDVKLYLEIERPGQLARALDFIFEQFDRHVLISRLKLQPISPLASGNVALLDQNPIDKVGEALETFAKGATSESLQRFFELSDKSAEAMKVSIDLRDITRQGKLTFFRGVEADLAELCIGKR